MHSEKDLRQKQQNGTLTGCAPAPAAARFPSPPARAAHAPCKPRAHVLSMRVAHVAKQPWTLHVSGDTWPHRSAICSWTARVRHSPLDELRSSCLGLFWGQLLLGGALQRRGHAPRLSFGLAAVRVCQLLACSQLTTSDAAQPMLGFAQALHTLPACTSPSRHGPLHYLPWAPGAPHPGRHLPAAFPKLDQRSWTVHRAQPNFAPCPTIIQVSQRLPLLCSPAAPLESARPPGAPPATQWLPPGCHPRCGTERAWHGQQGSPARHGMAWHGGQLGLVNTHCLLAGGMPRPRLYRLAG